VGKTHFQLPSRKDAVERAVQRDIARGAEDGSPKVGVLEDESPDVTSDIASSGADMGPMGLFALI
jgi:hypothetical protein